MGADDHHIARAGLLWVVQTRHALGRVLFLHLRIMDNGAQGADAFRIRRALPQGGLQLLQSQTYAHAEPRGSGADDLHTDFSSKT